MFGGGVLAGVGGHVQVSRVLIPGLGVGRGLVGGGLILVVLWLMVGALDSF